MTPKEYNLCLYSNVNADTMETTKNSKNTKSSVNSTRTVYKLLDSMMTVLYVGETGRPLQKRLGEHKRKLFPNAVEIVKLESGEWSRSESYQMQLIWQERYGMLPDNKKSRGTFIFSKEQNQTGGQKGGKITGPINGKITGNREHTCPKCGFTGKGNNMFRYHFEKCKHK